MRTFAGFPQRQGTGVSVSEQWRGIEAIASGEYHVLGLRGDGRVLAAGCGRDGQLDVSQLENIEAIAAGGNHSLGLTGDGRIFTAGANECGQLRLEELLRENDRETP